MNKSLRFEEQVSIRMKCCKQRMRLVGNLSLRGTAKQTILGYECGKCFRRVAVVDEWPEPTSADLEVIDTTE